MLKISRNILCLRTLGCTQKPKIKVFKRYLLSPGSLGLNEFDYYRLRQRERIYHRKDTLLKRLGAAVDEKKTIYTEDVTTLLYMVDNDKDFDFAIQVINRYQELKDNQIIKTETTIGFMMLQLLYLNDKVDMAFKWFLDGDYNVNPLCRNRECFMIMMDMLYNKEKYDDVISLLFLCENFIQKKYPELITLTMSSFYKMNSKESLQQMITLINDLTKNPVQLTSRCASLCCMLAYRQKEIDLMMEIMQLPMFRTISKKYSIYLPNLKILAYVKMGRVDEAVDILQDVVVTFQKPFDVFFDDTLDYLEKAVENLDDKELESRFKPLSKSLKASGFVHPDPMKEYIVRPIGKREYQYMCELDERPRNVYRSTQKLGDNVKVKDLKMDL